MCIRDRHQLETAKVEVTKPFPQEAELAEKLERLTELNALLNMDEDVYKRQVLDRLEGIYGDTNKDAGFTDRIREIAARIAQDCYGCLLYTSCNAGG